jgi:hypothetical protein
MYVISGMNPQHSMNLFGSIQTCRVERVPSPNAVKGRQEGHTNSALGSDMPDPRLRLEFSIKQDLCDGEIQRQHHSPKGGSVIQTRSKIPFPHATAVGAKG